MGPQELVVAAEPVEPWYAPLRVERWIFAINPANTGLMLAAFISLGVLLLRRVRARPSSPRRDGIMPEAGLRELLMVSAPEAEYSLTGTGGRAFAAYRSSLGIVQKVTGVKMSPDTTLREFLEAAIPRLPTAGKPFTELTEIAESALYSGREPDESTAARAELLATTIREELT